MSRGSVVMLANLLPHDGIPHAGGQYMRSLCRFLDQECDLTVLVPNNPASRAAAAQPGTPKSFRVVGQEQASPVAGKALTRAVDVIDWRLRRRDPGLPPLRMASDLYMNPSLRGLIRRAEVIDLQFSETIRLAPMMRRLNPSARLVGTFHDVQSQLFGREVDGSPEDAAFWLAAADRARREEAKAVRRLDETLVFSAKDAHLLGDPRNARIVRPPLARGDEVRHRAPMGRPTICFVAHLARPENEQAVVWFLQEGWARVRAAIPEARWVIAGAGASAELVDRVSQSPGVDLAGYVPDLSQVYTEASVALIPLRQGAGLKFKTVEAMLAGVPLVTTSVGAEGVAPDHYFALVADRVDHLTSAVIDVLQKPEHHQRRADEAQLWAQQSYGVDAFKQHIRAAYGWV